MKTITENTVQAGQGRMNIKEIARVAGVSPATISRVLNGSGYVKEETKKKVMAAVEKNNYTPSLIARSLSGRDSFSIGVILPSASQRVYSGILEGIDLVWGVPLIVLILATGIYLTVRLKGMQIRKLPAALRYMVQNEEEGSGEVTSFGALCTAMSATIGTGNIVGVATAIVAGGPGALFWMWIAALFGMATKYAEGVLAICYRSVDKETGHVLGGPFYYIENGMGKKWRWLGKIFAFFGAGVGLLGIGTFTQVNGITSAVGDFFDSQKACTVALFGREYTVAVLIDLILQCQIL